MSERSTLDSLVKKTTEIVHTEDLMIDAVRDIIKDEIKDHIKSKLDHNPELKKEFKEGIGSLFEAKAKEAYALVKLAKCTAKLGLESLPPHMKEQLINEFVSIFENEINAVLEKTI